MESHRHILSNAQSGISMPVQWCFKDKLPNGMHCELLLRRVKAGNESESEHVCDTGGAVHLKGKFSDWESLNSRFGDAEVREHSGWMMEAASALYAQMQIVAQQMPALLDLFAPKGKIELYGEGTQPFQPQYISGNFTLKIHADSLKNPQTLGNLFVHLIAQHLDYPFAPGERRFSTSRLFDLCFMAEKFMAPQGLAATIDAGLEVRGVYQPTRHTINAKDHVTTLLDGHSAAIRTSYERVLQRERFAAFIVALYGSPRSLHKSPLLGSYRQLVEVDLLSHKQADYKDYPPKAMDKVAETIHMPLMMIFNKQAKENKKAGTK